VNDGMFLLICICTTMPSPFIPLPKPCQCKTIVMTYSPATAPRRKIRMTHHEGHEDHEGEIRV
jgi:hypothetical protein